MLNKLDTDYVVYGRIATLELLNSERPVDKILIGSGENKGSILKIIAIAREKGIPIKEVSTLKLNSLCPNSNHQNVIAFAAAYKYSEIEDIFAIANEKNQHPFIIILDEIEDPHNMGAIIRTAEAAGAHGIIIPKRRNVGLTPIVVKTSAGACEHIPVARVSNICSTIEILKQKGLWIYSLDTSGDCWSTMDFSGPIGLVIGSESQGVSRIVKEASDFIVSLPMNGKINSLNASVAGGIVMYEIVRQRLLKS